MKRRWIDLLLPLLILVGAVFLRIQDGYIVTELRNRVFDTYQRLQPRPYPADAQVPVRILDIDEESLRTFGQWPWPRDFLARLLNRLTEAGVGAIALDMLQQEPDRTGPESLLKQWQGRSDFASLQEAIKQLPNPDAEYIQALKQDPAILSFAVNETIGGRAPICKVPFSYLGTAGDDPSSYLLNYPGVTSPLPAFEEAAAGNGATNALPDRDGIVRSVPLAVAYEGQHCGSIVSEALRVYQGAGNYIIKLAGANGEESFGQRTGLAAIKIGKAEIPVDASGRILLYDSNTRPERYLSIARFMQPNFDASGLAGNIVLIGSTAEGLKDFKATPLDPSMAGVEINAQLLEQIINGQFLSRPDYTFGVELVGLVLFGLVLMLMLHFLGALWSAIATVLAIALANGGSWYAFSHFGLLYDPAYPTIAAVAIYISGSLMGYLHTERERRHVRQIFGRYTSPEVVEELARSGQDVKLGGELRDLSVMFSDIRDFTKLAEKLDPQELTYLINSILTPLTDAIYKQRGSIDKYIGDCIMAFWNAPMSDAEHARNSLRAALAMRHALDQVNGKFAQEAQIAGKPFKPVEVGIGINSGPCSVGNMGSQQRVAYSALGDTVNLASRLESLTRAYGVHIIVGEDTAAGAPEMALLEIDRVQVKGRSQPLAIFTLLGSARDAAFEKLSTAQAAFLAAYRRKDWNAAKEAIAGCRSVAPDLAELYALFEKRIADYLSEPPPAEWDGVYVATSKTG
jgi:adenylate cyclase